MRIEEHTIYQQTQNAMQMLFEESNHEKDHFSHVFHHHINGLHPNGHNELWYRVLPTRSVSLRKVVDTSETRGLPVTSLMG